MKLLTSVALATLLALALAPLACSDNGNPVSNTTPLDGGIDPDASETGTGPMPQPGQPHPSANPQPKVTECTRAPLTPPATGTCSVTKPGTAGKVLQGTVLAPDELLHRGEILFDDTGSILCVACDCSADPAYAAATIVVVPLIRKRSSP
jgi:hypothetical protein